MMISESIIINAPLKQVWDIFTDLACWQDWAKDKNISATARKESLIRNRF